jgi:hypothetical protein
MTLATASKGSPQGTLGSSASVCCLSVSLSLLSNLRSMGSRHAFMGISSYAREECQLWDFVKLSKCVPLDVFSLCTPTNSIQEPDTHWVSVKQSPLLIYFYPVLTG